MRVPEEQALDCLESRRVDTLIVHYPPPGRPLRQDRDVAFRIARPAAPGP